MKGKKKLTLGIVAFSMMLSVFTFFGYQIIFTPNVLIDYQTSEGENVVRPDTLELIIPEGTNFQELLSILRKDSVLNGETYFAALAKWMNYQENIKSGSYTIYKGMTNRQLIRYLRSGEQNKVKVVFNNVRLKDELPELLAKNITATSEEIAKYFHNDSLAGLYGFDTVTIVSMFIPDTYEFYRMSSAKDVMDRMKKEYNTYWNAERIAKAKEIGLTKIEVSILASIVGSETNKNDEKPRVAGVYINRLRTNKTNGLLQADPTVKFALRDFSIKRVLEKHTAVDSPYNTYRYKGLPPGPIRLPSKSSLDAVLNYEKHDYLYFCASSEKIGYHTFTGSYIQHLKNAAKYHKYLNKNKIK